MKRNLSSWKINPFDWAYDFVYGIEADYRLVKTAKVSCFLNGDGLANVIHADGLDHFKKSTDYKGKLKEVSKDDPKDNGLFDVLVANPPYSVSAFKNTLKNGGESFELFNRLTDESSEIECLFIERTKQLLKPGGWAGIILPSSILGNSGIYTDAREIILKYFTIKAIAEFGSNTFMATGTNTVTLFLERRSNNDWKKIEDAIKNFFDKPKEATVNGIKNAFSKYVDEVFEDTTLQDYISLVNNKPNEIITKQELFDDYKTWFSGLTEIKSLKTKKSFKDKAKDEKQAELDKLFYAKVFAKEKDKMLYFFLAAPQKTVLIKVGEKQIEKDFIGYEFSFRRGHEGIKMYKDENCKPTTKLYDDDNHLNEEKANSYVYRAFLGEQKDIAEGLKNNLTNFNLTELINFKVLNFEKVISLGAKKQVDYKNIWKTEKLFPLSQISIIQKGSSITKAKTVEGSIPVVAGGQDLAYYHNASNREANVITVSASGAYSGFLNYWDKPIFASDCNTIVSIDENVISTKLLFEFLKSIQAVFYSLQRGQAQPHVYASDIEKIKIPVPQKSVQGKILAEIKAVEEKFIAGKDKLLDLNVALDKLFSELHHPIDKLGKLAEFKNGLNYSEKSTGESVTVVGVKDFLEDFSPNLDKLVDVQIDGSLTESYNLQSGDILVVRSNGSANLVGRFIYINKLNKVTSYSGFTIRIRANSERINSKYLCYCLRTEAVRNKITKDPRGSNIKSVNQTMLSAIDVPLPPIEVQREIIAKAEKLEMKIAKIENELAAMDEQKEQILKKHLK